MVRHNYYFSICIMERKCDFENYIVIQLIIVPLKNALHNLLQWLTKTSL